jgi:prevent-host-death family protein
MKTELVTSLKRKATDILSRLSEDHETVLITQHGKPAAYLVDVDLYEVMESRISMLEGIARGEKAVLEGRTVSHSQAKERLSRWLK